LKNNLVPDIMFDNIYDVTPELLKDIGIRGLVLDIDNTLVPYSEPIANRKLTEHLRKIESSGIQITLVSNNNLERVKKFNDCFGYYAQHNAGKPSSRCVRGCITHMKLNREEVLFVGDQIFTDCLSAHRAGVRCIIVKPIQPKENLFFNFKRTLEKPFITIYKNKRR